MNEELNKKMQNFAGIYAEGINGLNYPIDFPNDLNACFKYIVPKFLKEFGRYKTVALCNDAVCNSIENKTEVAFELCKAVEKLIDA